MSESSCDSISLSTFDVLDFGSSDRCAVVSHCFNLHFVYNVENLFIGLLDIFIFFGDLSVKIFAPLSNWIVCFLSVEY